MRQLNASETAARLPYPALADALRDVLRLRARGIAHAPPRLIVPLADDGLLLLMPATDGEIAITKLATAHTGNAARRLPRMVCCHEGCRNMSTSSIKAMPGVCKAASLPKWGLSL